MTGNLSDGDGWYFKGPDGQSRGPMSLDQVLGGISRGRVTATSMLFHPTLTDAQWCAAGKIALFSGPLTAYAGSHNASQSQPARSAATPGPSPSPLPQPPSASAPRISSTRRRSRKSSPIASLLFNGIPLLATFGLFYYGVTHLDQVRQVISYFRGLGENQDVRTADAAKPDQPVASAPATPTMPNESTPNTQGAERSLPDTSTPAMSETELMQQMGIDRKNQRVDLTDLLRGNGVEYEPSPEAMLLQVDFAHARKLYPVRFTAAGPYRLVAMTHGERVEISRGSDTLKPGTTIEAQVIDFGGIRVSFRLIDPPGGATSQGPTSEANVEVNLSLQNDWDTESKFTASRIANRRKYLLRQAGTLGKNLQLARTNLEATQRFLRSSGTKRQDEVHMAENRLPGLEANVRALTSELNLTQQSLESLNYLERRLEKVSQSSFVFEPRGPEAPLPQESIGNSIQPPKQ